MDYTYRGYTIRPAREPKNLSKTANSNWDIYDDKKLRKHNLASIETAKHVVDVMLKYGYWPERGTIE